MDEIDRAILRELHCDARMTTEELARRLHVSRPTASRHLNRLLAGGGVKVVGVAHPTVQGTTAMGHTAVVTDGRAEQLAGELAEFRDAVFVSVTLGTMSLIAEIRARTGDDFQNALDRIRAHPGTVSTNTVLYSEILRDVLQPAPLLAASVDQIDLDLIEALRRDGRSSYADLATGAGISVTTARTRVRRLISGRLINIGIIQERPSEDNLLRFGVGIRIRGVARAVDALLDMPELHFITTAVGRFDLIVTVDGVTRSEAKDVLARIAALPQVLSTESWLHLQVIKEQY
ncbi:Lrp/AsnC family transcriptional regulator [Mycobacterium sp. smrl_JER01]|uniref:Lrp/AsnC family transcriptional regulator n=1 Tax=Mycobacterium sp. smrl_JER01 TaxID=3402633 RepID=UPI003AC2401A